jgi:methylthioribose-1-phosphate isomerase
MWNDTVRWENDGSIRLIDQTLLPQKEVLLKIQSIPDLAEAIKSLRVRGAPAIGIAAAFGVALAAHHYSGGAGQDFSSYIHNAIEHLAGTRPTAVNLFWALDRMRKKFQSSESHDISEIKIMLLNEARAILDEDKAVCRAIGRNGALLLPESCTVLTHCNAGGLATGDYGTALGVIYAAAESGKKIKVYADETRPLLQGSRLTAWELTRAGIDVTVCCDSSAAVLMSSRRIDAVITGADRIASNGDTANKVGTYMLSVLAKEHHIPFYIAAPVSTFDFQIKSGAEIPIEQREADEVIKGFGCLTAPEGVKVFNPAFDVTPHSFISGIITEKGVLKPPFETSIQSLPR